VKLTVMRGTLDVEQVLAQAEAIVDVDGWDALSMAKLAAQLDVRVPSLYTHVESLESVRAELQHRSMRSFGTVLQEAAMGRSGAEALRSMAGAYRRQALAYRHRYDGMTRRPIDREGLRSASMAAEAALRAALRAFQLDDTAIREAQLTIFATAHGFIALEIAGFWATDLRSDDLYGEAIERMIQALEPERHGAT
jgi:AcrR family transcriptional regulator